MTETEEKALELVAENRVIILHNDAYNRYPASNQAIVAGHTAHYTITATHQGLECSCPSRRYYCSHVLAAMIAWNDR